MLSSEVSSNPLASLANKPATVQQRQFALVVAVLLFVGLAVAAPFADTPLILAEVPAVIPTVQGMIFVNDLVTSTILFAQYSTVPSRAFLVLANGYLFTARECVQSTGIAA
jgi:hypothetical protein